MDSRSPNQVQEQRFNIVVPMVSDAYSLGATLPAHFGKPVITQLASRHFQTESVALGKAASAEMTYRQRDIDVTAQPPAESLIRFALYATEFKITMQGFHPEAQFLQGKQQANAVGASRETHQQEFVGSEVRRKVLTNTL